LVDSSGANPEYALKPLFILGRARRSITTLETELEQFEQKIEESMENAVTCGDLVFWPVRAVPPSARIGRKPEPIDFWHRHREALESGLLSEIVIGELGKCMFSSSETRCLDRFQGNVHMYGTEDSSPPSIAPEDTWLDECAFDEGEREEGRYENRLFWTIGAQDWFDRVAIAEETPSFGRKLIIIIGRQPERRFLDGALGQKLRARLGPTAAPVFSSQHEDVVVIAFEHYAPPDEVFEQIRGLMPPRLVEDFLIADIGLKYHTGGAPISLFAEWDEGRSNRHAGRKRHNAEQGTRGATIPVERIKRWKPRKILA
jgi:hypothetical protein